MVRTLALLLLFVASPLTAQEFRVGAGAVKITPVNGTPMAGYYHERGSDGVHDDLFAKALVLERSGTRAALVALDLISTNGPMVAAARREIERATGIPGDHVMISATHSHTGPLLSTRNLRERFLGGQSDLAQRYAAELPGKIAEAVVLADKAKQPARVWIGRGKEESLAFNRRFHMKDGSVGWNPGKLNPNVVKPAGPIDPDVPVVYFETPDRKPLAVYVNYAVHLDNVGGTQISADLPYTVSRLLADVKGKDLVTIYSTGCCGDVNHVNVRWAEKQQGHDNAARMGIVLAAEVLRILPHLQLVEAGPLFVKTAKVPLPLAPIKPEEVEQAKAILAAQADTRGSRAKFLDLVQAFKVMDVVEREGKPLEVEVQVIALGQDVAWVSLPGEIFVELGLAIKQDSPIPLTILAELANGSIGYVPARRAYNQGNYEVVSARCAEGSGELLVEAAVRLLKEAYAVQRKDKP